MCTSLSVPSVTWLCMFSSFGTNGPDIPKLEDMYSHVNKGIDSNCYRHSCTVLQIFLHHINCR